MIPFQAVVRTLGVAAICHVSTACHFPDLPNIGDAKTAAELAPSLETIREATPEHHRRLADGTFDSLSVLEQWDFVAEVRDAVGERREVERAEAYAAGRLALQELLDQIEDPPPEGFEEVLAFHRWVLLLLLKMESDLLAIAGCGMDGPRAWVEGRMPLAFNDDASQEPGRTPRTAMDSARTFATGVVCVSLATYGLGTTGGAETGAELAPSVEPLREVVPEHYRRLVDGTFDSLSLVEQWGFVEEVQDILQEQRETRNERFNAAWRQSIVELLDSVETLPPVLAERDLASRREELLRSLKFENEALQLVIDPLAHEPETEEE